MVVGFAAFCVRRKPRWKAEEREGVGPLVTEKEENQEIKEICKITKTPLPLLFPSQTVQCLIPPVYFVSEFLNPTR